MLFTYHPSHTVYKTLNTRLWSPYDELGLERKKYPATAPPHHLACQGAWGSASARLSAKGTSFCSPSVLGWVTNKVTLQKT